MKALKLLFDGDMFVYRACASAETEINWGGDLWTLHSDAAEVKEHIDSMILSITDVVLNHLKYEGAYEIVMCFSDKDNFRKHLLPTYKQNRADKRKPLAYYSVVNWVKENFTTQQFPRLEADDVIGILATQPNTKAVIISGDKDMKSIPAIFYDFIHGEFHDVSLEEANYWHLYQTLVGDVADNYKGCPKVGAVSATKLLAQSPTWETVVSAFEKAGLTEDDALVQARVAYILRAENYKDDLLYLWLPKNINDTHKEQKKKGTSK